MNNSHASEGAEMDVTPLSGPENGLSGDLGAAHMETFRAPELDTDTGGADAVVQVDEGGAPLNVETAVEQMSKGAFFVVFNHAFGLPGMFMPDFRPLAIQPEEEPIARDASDAIYELLEIYWPQALLPQGDTFARIARAAPFILAKVMILRMILMERRRARMAPPPVPDAKASFKSRRTPEAANTNAPPEGETVDPFAWAEAEQQPEAA